MEKAHGRCGQCGDHEVQAAWGISTSITTVEDGNSEGQGIVHREGDYRCQLRHRSEYLQGTEEVEGWIVIQKESDPDTTTTL